MPILYIMLADVWGTQSASAPTVVSVPMASSTGTTVWLNNAITTSSTASNIVWVNMATSAFDSCNIYQGQLAGRQQQMMAQLAMQQQLLNASPGGIMNVYQPSDLQMIERDRRMRDDHEHARQATRNREAARNRARDLLLHHLTDAQRKTFLSHGWFVVEGGKSKRPYRIHVDRGPAGNVIELTHPDLLGHSREVARLCGHVRRSDMTLPDYDEYLAQKLMLEADEDGYRALANRSMP